MYTVWPGTGSYLVPLAHRGKLAEAIHGHKEIDWSWHYKLQPQHLFQFRWAWSNIWRGCRHRSKNFSKVFPDPCSEFVETALGDLSYCCHWICTSACSTNALGLLNCVHGCAVSRGAAIYFSGLFRLSLSPVVDCSYLLLDECFSNSLGGSTTGLWIIIWPQAIPVRLIQKVWLGRR